MLREHFGKGQAREFFKYFVNTPTHIRMKNTCQNTQRKHIKEMIVNQQFSFVGIIVNDENEINEVAKLNKELNDGK